MVRNIFICMVDVILITYFFILFKIDRGIRDEIAGMVTTLGLPWPKWL